MDTTEITDSENVETTAAASVATAGDAKITTSFVGIVNAEGGAQVSQSAGLAVVSGADASISQAGAATVIAKSVSGEKFGSGVILAGDVSVSHGWVGIVASPKVELSDNSRILIGPVAALIIGAGILGVFGIAVAIAWILARRASEWRPKVPSISWQRMSH